MNRKKLLEEGIGYLGRFAKLARKLRVQQRPDPELEKEIRKQVKVELGKIRDRECHTYVVSNEKFTGDKMVAYRNSGIIASSLKNIFAPFQFDIKIIVFIRRQDKFIESTYAQRVYSGSTLTFQKFLDKFDTSDFHWTDLLDSYANVFGKENILVRGFDKKYLPDKNSLIHTFGRDIGSDTLRNYFEKTIRNRGYSRDTLEIARLANQYVNKREKRQLRDLLRKADPQSNSYSYFSNKERKKFLENYESSNKQVALDYLGDSRGELFSTPDYSQAESEHIYEGLTPETVAVVLSKSLVALKQELIEEIDRNRKTKLSKRIFSKIKKIAGKFR